MKERIFEMSEHGPFKAKVDERYHKLGQDCPDDGWVAGYLYRDLCGGEIVPIIFNAPCRWRVQEETIEPVGFHIAQWIKVEDRLPDEGRLCLIRLKGGLIAVSAFEIVLDDKGKEFGAFAVDGSYYTIDFIIHWMPIIPPKDNEVWD